ncbi:MAG: CDP-alcohol phosphatidyltransferase family protein [Bacteroidota bacterium]
MLSVYQIKPAFQRLLKPSMFLLRKWGCSPNHLSLFTIFFSVGVGSLFFLYPQRPFVFLLIPLGLFLRMALNALDGMMARTFHLQSEWGEVLNELGDVISDLAISLPLLSLSFFHPLIILAFSFMSVIMEFIGVLAKALGKERAYEGPMGKSDRAVLIGLFCLYFYFFPPNLLLANSLFGIASILMILGSIFRIKAALK